MNESNGKKQTAALWILGILVVILIAIIVGLFIMQAQTRNKELVAKDEKTVTFDANHEMAGKVWGIAGLGNIGRRVAAVAKALGCRVIAYK